MSQHCPVCDQLLLEDEPVCWQCGHILVPTAPATTSVPATGGERRKEARLSPRLVYGALTLLIITGALYLTAFLGRQPRVHAALTDLPGGWTWIRGAQNDFTFYLPEKWDVLKAIDDGRERELDDVMRANPNLGAAFYPLSRLDPRLRVILYAHGPIPGEPVATGVVLVARSRTLNRLTPQDLVSLATDAAEELDVALETAGEVETFDQRYVYLDVSAETAGGRQRCQQQLFPGEAELLWITVCGPLETRYQQILSAILGSFQRLRS